MKRYGFVSQRGEIIKIDNLLDSIGVSTKSKVQEDSTQPKDNYERMRPYHTTKVDLLTNSCVYVSSAAEIIARDITGDINLKMIEDEVEPKDITLSLEEIAKQREELLGQKEQLKVLKSREELMHDLFDTDFYLEHKNDKIKSLLYKQR